MSEPIALKVLKLPSWIIKKVAYVYKTVVFLPTNCLYYLGKGIVSSEQADLDSVVFQTKQTPRRLVRGLFSVLLSFVFLLTTLMPLWLCYVWMQGIKHSQIILNTLKKTLGEKLLAQAIEKGLVNIEKANLSTISKILIYGVCLMSIFLSSKGQMKKYGAVNFQNKRMNRMVLVFLYALHGVFDMVTLVCYLVTLPFSRIYPPENFQERAPVLGHFQILSNLCRSLLLVPVIFASILLPIARRINFRELDKLETYDSYHDCGRIWVVMCVLLVDLAYILILRVLHFILARNKLVKPWKTFRFNAVKAPGIVRLEILFNGCLLGMLYLLKNDRLASLNLQSNMTEREHISKAAVQAIGISIKLLLYKIMVLCNPRRSAAFNILHDRVTSIKQNGKQKYTNCMEYITDRSLQLAT